MTNFWQEQPFGAEDQVRHFRGVIGVNCFFFAVENQKRGSDSAQLFWDEVWLRRPHGANDPLKQENNCLQWQVNPKE